MLAVGVTGGIGCGKTEVAKRFEKLGVPVIDADQITRELVEPGSAVLAAIIARFGDDMLSPEGELDRTKLRQIIFQDPKSRQDLEQLLHPRVKEEILRRIHVLSAHPYCLVVIPLMVETGMESLVDRVLVVDCEDAQQVNRVTARDGSPEDAVRAIMATQAARQTRLAKASDIIRNTGTFDELQQEVEQFHQQFVDLSRQTGN